MEIKQIWQSEGIQLLQVCWENNCLNVVLINNAVVKISSDWETVVEFLDQYV